MTTGILAPPPATESAGLVGSKIDPASVVLQGFLQNCMGALAHESLQVLFLDGHKILIAHEQLQQGSAHALLLDPKAIFRRAIALDASAVILAHNHPSGDPRPSREDIHTTASLVRLGQMLDIEVVEHLIVARHSCYAILQGNGRSTARGLAAFFDLSDSAAGCLHQQGCICATAAHNARTAARRGMRRHELLGHPSLLGNPAWDMLIDLFLHAHAGKPVSTSALCFGSGMPMSNALRLIRKLCDSGIVMREPDPRDGRRNFITLPLQTLEGLNSYFCERTD
jgi:DNA repair protein RadC